MAKLIKIPMVIKTFGNSMYPLLLDGDVLYLKKIKFSKIRVNDLITVRNKNNYFTHRVIYKGKNYLITRGDNNPLIDGMIYAKNIVGIVEKVKRQGNIFNPEQIYLLQSSLYFAEIVKIKNILEENKIEHVFLKGLPLHLYFEKTHPRRLYADCDILISKLHYSKAISILKHMGFKRGGGQKSIILSKDKKTLLNDIGEITYYKFIKGFPIFLDIHLETVFITVNTGNRKYLYPNQLIENFTDKLLREKKQVKIQNELFPILSNENLLIYLCLHIFHHNLLGIYRYELVSKVIEKNNINYDSVLKTVNHYKLNNFIYPIMLLLIKYYGSRLPRSFMKSIKPGALNDYIIKRIFLKTGIFDNKEEKGSGKRFMKIFLLSPTPLYRRTLIFANPFVIKKVVEGLYLNYIK